MVAIEIVQQKLFKLSDSERAEKIEQLLGALDEREHLGVPESHLGPQMTAARDEERRRS